MVKMVSGDRSHEQMSVKMVDYIVDEHHIDIDAESMKKVKEMILASSKYATTQITCSDYCDFVQFREQGTSVSYMTLWQMVEMASMLTSLIIFTVIAEHVV